MKIVNKKATLSGKTLFKIIFNGLKSLNTDSTWKMILSELDVIVGKQGKPGNARVALKFFDT